MKCGPAFRQMSRWLAFVGLTALPLGTLGACGSSEEQPTAEHYFRVEENQDGVPVAVTSWVPKYEQPLFSYEEIVHLHQDESRPETLLNRPSQFIVGEDGSYYIVDYRDGRVVIFDAEGNYAGQIGRAGDGPGEFRWPSAVWSLDGHIFVFDQRTRRTSEFGADGAYLRGFSYPRAANPIEGIYPGPDGAMMVYLAISRGNLDGSRDRGRICLFLDAEGDSLTTLESRLEHSPPSIEIPGTRMAIVARQFYSASDYIYCAPGTGAIHYNGLDPDLRLYGLDGSLIRIIHVDSPPAPVTEADRAKVIDFIRRESESAETEEMRIANRAMLDHLTFAELMPYFVNLSVDEDGYFWLYGFPEYELEDPYDAPPAFLVLSPEGELLGRTTTPESRGSISRGHYCVLRADPDTGEITPVVYRISSAVPGFVYP